MRFFKELAERWGGEPELDPKVLELIERRVRESNRELLERISGTLHNIASTEGMVRGLQVLDAGIRDLAHGIHESIELNREMMLDLKQDLNDRVDESEATVEALVDVLNDRAKNDANFDKAFHNSSCPFDKRVGHCKIWEHRPVRNDAPNYCAPCRLQRLLADRGL